MGRETMTLGQAAALIGGKIDPNHAQIAFHGVNFDTRRLQEGQLFVAMAGARDGHDFVPQALEKGAVAVLASKPLDASIPAIYVEDTAKALQDLAREYRKLLPLRCVGVTGSVGKTTTKEMIATVLQQRFLTHKTEGNFNNNIGLPVTVLSMDSSTQAAVLEMGMNHFGEISLLTSIALPDIAVITNIGTMHIENLGSREGILQAKLEILEGLSDHGCAVFCGDEELLYGAAQKHRAITYGFMEHNPVRALEAREEGFSTVIEAEAFGQPVTLEIPTLGRHNVLNALAALTVGLLCGMLPEEIAAGLKNFENTGLRQKVYEQDGIRIIADCYNAGPESMEAAFAVLEGNPGRKIAVLGGMLELGDHAPQAHYKVGQLAAKKANALFAYGACSEEYVRGATDGGLAFAKTYETHAALAQELREFLRPGDTLLCKGSRGMKMETVLALLSTDTENGGKQNV